jgi:DNA polymerase III sliding clamp (beta) subunit (PCNA family)
MENFQIIFRLFLKNNQKKLEIDLKSFLGSVDRVASVSLDKKRWC